MIKVNGRMKTDVTITIQEGIEVLVKDCAAHGKDFSNITKGYELDITFCTALFTLKTYYAKLVGEESTISVSGIFDSAQQSFYVESQDVLDSLYKLFSQGNTICASGETNRKDKGVYSYYDASYHGSPDWQYTLMYKGEEAEKTLHYLNVLKKGFYEYLNTPSSTKIYK